MEHILETDVIQFWPANNDSVCKKLEHLRLTQKNIQLWFAFVYNSGSDRQSDWFSQQELPNKSFECPLDFVYSCSSKLEII